MATQTCPECGCIIGEGSYMREGINYCCEACAEGEACECGCCEVEKDEENEERLSG